MGTKNNPGKFDCYANAKPDEPLFVLLARDPLAPFLVSMWAAIRMGDYEKLATVFTKMSDTYLERYAIYPDVDKASEAMECAQNMFNYYEELTNDRPR